MRNEIETIPAESQKQTGIDVISNKVNIFEYKDVPTALNAIQSINSALLSLKTPKGAKFNRQGANDKNGNPQYWTYVIDDYFKHVLNRLSPVWSYDVIDLVRDEFISESIEKVFSNGIEQHILLTRRMYKYRCIGVLTLMFRIGDEWVERRISDTGTGDVKTTSGGDFMADTAAKGAVTDAFKRCGARLGIATDVYGKSLASDINDKIFFSLLLPHLDQEKPGTRKLISQFQEQVYDTQQVVLIRKLADEILPAISKPTDVYKDKTIDQLYDMYLDIVSGIIKNNEVQA